MLNDHTVLTPCRYHCRRARGRPRCIRHQVRTGGQSLSGPRIRQVSPSRSQEWSPACQSHVGREENARKQDKTEQGRPGQAVTVNEQEATPACNKASKSEREEEGSC